MIALLLLAQDVVLERTVTSTTIDVLGRRGEVRRRERVSVRGSDVAITDLTFGERLLIRSDLRRVWKADPMAGTYFELSFEEAAALRKEALDELLACKGRVPGTAEEKELAAVLEGLDRYDGEPAVELKAAGARREVVVNGDRVRLSADVDPAISAPGYFEALGALGAFHPAVGAKLKELGGFPTKGTFRYAFLLDRVIDTFEGVTAKPGPAPAADFEPPAGLRKVPPPGSRRKPERVPARPAEVKKSFGEDDGDRKEREAENKP